MIESIITAYKSINLSFDQLGSSSDPPAIESSSSASNRLKAWIHYSSLSSTTKKLAQRLTRHLRTSSAHLDPELVSLDDLDLDRWILETPTDSHDRCSIILLPSYNVESPIDSILAQFRDALFDFRLSNHALSGLRFIVIGIGHSDYRQEFCKQAVELDEILERLGARRILPLIKIDVSIDPEKQLDDHHLIIQNTLDPSIASFSQIPTIVSDRDRIDGSQDLSIDSNDDDDDDDDDDQEDQIDDSNLLKPLSKIDRARLKSKSNKKKLGIGRSNPVDIEDLGTGLPQLQDPPVDGDQSIVKKEMISPMTRKSLTKQGYAIVGSHSAVKTCRWTKASLRGRGFCYKHAFYGIQSHRCMEATPSLACANKCTFCWRSHTNPVGTSWRWKTDDAEFVVNESLKEHDRLIKQLTGMPGVRSDRFEEARTPRHAALSLVGEPVMFPHIKKYISLLTEKRISTFLVTNAQFPESLRDLPPVTQLYLSIDAGTKETLKSIDRPLHRDYWERFLESIDIVRQKSIRTVFRLTLVKGENSSEIREYARLVRRGQPDFIEVKGVTYCGYPGSSNLTIKNSPWHDEVIKFVEDLCEEINDPRHDPDPLDPELENRSSIGLEYGLAAEHAHSCCVLAGHKKYLIDDRWHTWIDYDKFFELIKTGRQDFDGLEYCSLTPDFALFGSPEAGFSPEDQRWFRKQKNST